MKLEINNGNMVVFVHEARELEERRQKELKIKEAIKKGYIMPTQRSIGRRKYTERLPEFKEVDSDIPNVKNIEASQEALK